MADISEFDSLAPYRLAHKIKTTIYYHRIPFDYAIPSPKDNDLVFVFEGDLIGAINRFIVDNQGAFAHYFIHIDSFVEEPIDNAGPKTSKSYNKGARRSYEHQG